ncbi:MAG: thiamine pyrophosphate-dependent enzyme [Methanosarcina sp.]
MTEKKLLMGNEAIALGAIEAGVQVVTGYPGTPSTEALETILRYADRYGIYAEWSSNEKVALETAVGAAYSGTKTLVTMKQVGLNVASDPLMSLSYIGIKGALVLLVADDPGPHSSQTEQDTRVFGHFANIPVLDPANPQEAYELTKLAFEISHEFEIPVILRTTTRVSHSCGDVELESSETGVKGIAASCEGFTKDRRWTIFPRLTAERHPWLEKVQIQLSDRFSEIPYNSISETANSKIAEKSKIGILASGVSALYAKEAIKGYEELFTLFKIGTVYPFPEKAVLSFLEKSDIKSHAEKADLKEIDLKRKKIDLERKETSLTKTGLKETALIGPDPVVESDSIEPDSIETDSKGTDKEKIENLIVIEELDPYLEEQLLQLIGKEHLTVNVFGKKNGFFPVTGEYNVDLVIDGINKVLSELGENQRLLQASPIIAREKLPPLPIRAPTLCAGCMHRTVFYTFKQAAKQLKKDIGIETIFSGDIGCYTLGNASPLNMVDTCLCMGAGISLAGGLSRTNPEAKHVAFIGDSTFFHSGIPAIVNAVYNSADITLVVLDNRTTAMTGHQPHPGIGKTALGSASKAIDISGVVRSCGVEYIRTINIDDISSGKKTNNTGQDNKEKNDPKERNALDLQEIKIDQAKTEDMPLSGLEYYLNAAKEAMDFKGPSVIVFKGKCVGIVKPEKSYSIDSDKCTGCGFCVKQLGCPALFLPSENSDENTFIASGANEPIKPLIQENCSGCGLCAAICPSGAIFVKEVRL